MLADHYAESVPFAQQTVRIESSTDFCSCLKNAIGEENQVVLPLINGFGQ